MNAKHETKIFYSGPSGLPSFDGTRDDQISFGFRVTVDANCPNPPESEIREMAEKLISIIKTAWNEGYFEPFKSSRQEFFRSVDKFEELAKAAGKD